MSSLPNADDNSADVPTTSNVPGSDVSNPDTGAGSDVNSPDTGTGGNTNNPDAGTGSDANNSGSGTGNNDTTSGSGTGNNGASSEPETGKNDANSGADLGNKEEENPVIIPDLSDATQLASLGLIIIRIINSVLDKFADVQTKLKDALANLKILMQKVVNDVIKMIKGEGTVNNVNLSMSSIPDLMKLAITELYNDGLYLGSVALTLERKLLVFGAVTVPKKIINMPISIIDKIISLKSNTKPQQQTAT